MAIVKLRNNFIAALRREKFQRLQRRPVILAESVPPRDFAPLAKDVIAHVRAPLIGLREWFRVKIAKPRQTFHAKGDKVADRKAMSIPFRARSALAGKP